MVAIVLIAVADGVNELLFNSCIHSFNANRHVISLRCVALLEFKTRVTAFHSESM